MNDLIEASVLVCTYNPRWDALQFTLDSLVNQKNITFEIIITDDGSKNNLKAEIEKYFNDKHFLQWEVVCNTQNLGTVCNIHTGLQMCHGKVIKTISPGDALINDNVLRNWIDYNTVNNYRWSFSDAIYYTEHPWKNHTVKAPAHPLNVTVYKKNKTYACRWYYSVFDDNALGAAMICEKNLMSDYCNKIVGKIKYAEDNIFRMMMFDGIIGGYYPKNTVLYEFGSGISTCTNNIWHERLIKDFDVADEIMSDCQNPDSFQKSMIQAFKFKRGSKIKRLFIKGKLFFTIQKKINPRMTDVYQGCKGEI